MTHPSDVRFMTEALALAREAAQQGEVPVGAVVVQDDQVVGRGHNLREARQDFAAHAEFLAMQEACRTLGSWRLTGCTVYVTLEPCPMCAGAMVLSRVDRCVYGTVDPKGGFLGTLGDLSQMSGLNHRFEVTSGVMGEACAHELRTFFRELRKHQERWPSG